MFDKSTIFATAKPTLIPIEVPEWGGTFYLKPMTGNQREKLERSMLLKLPDIRARTIVYSLVKIDGEPVFEESDIESVNTLPYPVLYRVFEEAEKVNAISNKAVEEHAKN